MSQDPEFVCPSCQAPYTPGPKGAQELAGMAVVGLSVLAAVGMLVLIKQGNTTAGGACAMAAMALLGLGMWLKKRGRAGCPACGHSLGT